MTRTAERVAELRALVGKTRHAPAPAGATPTEAIQVTCPHCGAGPHQACTNPATRARLRSGSHPSRLEALGGAA